MMYSMWTLHYREISLAETLRSSLHMILGWYQDTGDKKLLELIRLHLQAYVNTGNSLNPEMEEIRTALETLGQGQEAFRPDSCVCRASLSASEYTATVRIPISRHARIIRTAISPLLAIKIFPNICYAPTAKVSSAITATLPS